MTTAVNYEGLTGINAKFAPLRAYIEAQEAVRREKSLKLAAAKAKIGN